MFHYTFFVSSSTENEYKSEVKSKVNIIQPSSVVHFNLFFYTKKKHSAVVLRIIENEIIYYISYDYGHSSSSPNW